MNKSKAPEKDAVSTSNNGIKDVDFASLRPFIKAPTLNRDQASFTAVQVIASDILSYTQTRLLHALHERFATPFFDLNEVVGRILNEPTLSHLDIALLSDAFNRSMNTMRSSLIASLRDEHVIAFRDFSERLHKTLRDPLSAYESSIHRQHMNAIPGLVREKTGGIEPLLHITVDPDYYSAIASELLAFKAVRVMYIDDDDVRHKTLKEPIKTMCDLLAFCDNETMCSYVMVRLYVSNREPDCLNVHMVSMTKSAEQAEARVREARSVR